MKKLMSCLIICFCTYSGFSQDQISGEKKKEGKNSLNRGTFMIGGIFEGNLETNKDLRYLDYEFGSNQLFGIFVVRGLAIGVTSNYGISGYKTENRLYSSSSTYNSISNMSYKAGFGPFIRYYFRSGFLLHFSSYAISSYSQTKYNNSSYVDPYGVNYVYQNESRSKVLRVSPGLGYAFFINRNIALEAMAMYCFSYSQYSSYFYYSDPSTNSGNNSYHNILLSFGFSTFF